MNDNTFLNKSLDLVPKNPGVYLMKDSSGSVIYVGKAVNLRNRLRSYFSPNPKGNTKTLSMITKIADFDFIVCDNETEALLLECNFIKMHNPKYNILMRDDKEYPYIRITLNEEYPRVLKAFRIGEDIRQGAKYYGPYLSGNLKAALDTLKTIFPIKTCNKVFPRDIGKERPCLNFYIGKCTGPCRGDVSKDEYRKSILDICNFLEGRYDEIIKGLKHKMKEFSENFEYEKAAIFRDRLNSLTSLISKQSVSDSKIKDTDIVGFASGEYGNCIRKLEIRQGRMIGDKVFFTESREEEKGEIAKNILLMHYTDTMNIPGTIYLPFEITENDIFEGALSSLAGKKVKIKIPVKGSGKKLIELAANNAEISLNRHFALSGGNRKARSEAVNILSKIIYGEVDKVKRIDAFDVSNYGRDDKSCAMTVFIEGEAEKSLYRLFKIKDLETQNDYASIKQVIERRVKRMEEESHEGIPDIILVDGGKTHVDTVVSVLKNTKFNSIPVMGMVKNSKHRTRGLIKSDGAEILLVSKNTQEQNLLSPEEQTIVLKLIAAIQNETHRFAVSYTRKLSGKRNMKFSLEGIKGIGPERRKALLNHFGSIREISNAGIEELEKVDKINRQAAIEVFNHFKEG